MHPTNGRQKCSFLPRGTTPRCPAGRCLQTGPAHGAGHQKLHAGEHGLLNTVDRRRVTSSPGNACRFLPRAVPAITRMVMLPFSKSFCFTSFIMRPGPPQCQGGICKIIMHTKLLNAAQLQLVLLSSAQFACSVLFAAQFKSMCSIEQPLRPYIPYPTISIVHTVLIVATVDTVGTVGVIRIDCI